MNNTPKVPLSGRERITDEVDIDLGPQPNYFEMDEAVDDIDDAQDP